MATLRLIDIFGRLTLSDNCLTCVFEDAAAGIDIGSGLDRSYRAHDRRLISSDKCLTTFSERCVMAVRQETQQQATTTALSLVYTIRAR